jgi:hypothetical protein
MHSASQSRFKSRTTQANVSVGTDFTTPRIMVEDANKKARKWLTEHGFPPINKHFRLVQLYKKWKLGRLQPGAADKVYRDHQQEFDAFDASGAFAV